MGSQDVSDPGITPLPNATNRTTPQGYHRVVPDVFTATEHPKRQRRDRHASCLAHASPLRTLRDSSWQSAISSSHYFLQQSCELVVDSWRMSVEGCWWRESAPARLWIWAGCHFGLLSARTAEGSAAIGLTFGNLEPHEGLMQDTPVNKRLSKQVEQMHDGWRVIASRRFRCCWRTARHASETDDGVRSEAHVGSEAHVESRRLGKLRSACSITCARLRTMRTGRGWSRRICRCCAAGWFERECRQPTWMISSRTCCSSCIGSCPRFSTTSLLARFGAGCDNSLCIGCATSGGRGDG